jgi:hypothetical protein
MDPNSASLLDLDPCFQTALLFLNRSFISFSHFWKLAFWTAKKVEMKQKSYTILCHFAVWALETGWIRVQTFLKMLDSGPCIMNTCPQSSCCEGVLKTLRPAVWLDITTMLVQNMFGSMQPSYMLLRNFSVLSLKNRCLTITSVPDTWHFGVDPDRNPRI